MTLRSSTSVLLPRNGSVSADVTLARLWKSPLSCGSMSQVIKSCEYTPSVGTVKLNPVGVAATVVGPLTAPSLR